MGLLLRSNELEVVQSIFLEPFHQLVCHTGVHDDLIKDPDGAYSQLIRLQQAHSKEMHEVPNTEVSGSIYKSRSLSLEQSIARDSPRNRGQHSFRSSIGLSGFSDEFNRLTDRQKHEESGDSYKVPKKAPIRRLFKLNKPEEPVLLLAVIAAFVHGLLFPSFSIMMSGGIRTFYYPPHQLRKDSRFWALVCLLFAVISLISIQVEYFLFGVAGGKLIQRVRSLTFQSIVHQEVAWFDDPSNSRLGLICYLNSRHQVDSFLYYCLDIKFMVFSFYSGALGARLYIDALNIRRLVGDNLAILVQCVVTVIAGFSIAFFSDWKLTLVVICVIPVVGSQNYIQVKFLKGFSEDAKVNIYKFLLRT